MLKVEKSFETTDKKYKDVNIFLERVLVEVVAENYRYFLNERLLNSNADTIPKIDFWAPLLAKERQCSGLFAVALSHVCPVSRPEYAIKRPLRSVKKSADSAQKSNGGRVDFLARYGQRNIAFELKRSAVSSSKGVKNNRGLSSLWESVKRQSQEALVHMRAQEQSPLYSPPVSIGLLVIRIDRKVAGKKDPEAVRSDENKNWPQIISDIEKKFTSANFIAHYVPPIEMQTVVGWGKNKSEHKIFPGVIFAAIVHRRATSTIKIER